METISMDSKKVKWSWKKKNHTCTPRVYSLWQHWKLMQTFGSVAKQNQIWNTTCFDIWLWISCTL